MKNIKYFLVAFIAIGSSVFYSCENDDADDLSLDFQAPSNLDLTFNISQDNSGLVIISPSGTNVGSFEVFYGDGTGESVILPLGDNAQRNYPEGSFTVRVVAKSLGGQTAEIVKDLSVSYRTPENLQVTVTESTTSNFGVIVTATADFASSFEVTFGEDPTLTPITFTEDESASYEYSAIGEYTITVTALSGGAATTQTTETITIDNPPEPILLPLDFEDDRRQYDIGTNNGSFSIVPNPVPGTNNNSSTVGQFDRNQTGGNNFALVAIVIDEAPSFDANTTFTLKVYSPRAGLPVWLKIERVGNNSLFQEVTNVTTTVANAWETLTFTNFSGNTTEDLRNVVIFFDPLGATSAAETIYIDELIQTN
ncbi:hypothetical protein [Nonlabens agnitus]|uniref:PKD domain-containing protein n=1 Tax=Nonlabens agnitus TaxID=870484 RepID=A0A2S9WWF2_9FLAO|nr:hypothetical protein [Nonlabens agnitus]PRP67809.1 hypothetical protein BST86_12245 [Nonlabens agnitus]